MEVKNTHGFLPANEYYKMSFYGLLATVSAIIAVVWVVQLVRFSNQVHSVHYCMAVVLCLVLAEAFLWRMMMSSWNEQGVFAPWMMCGANLASVLKSGLCFVLVCYIAQGWGVTHDSLESVSKFQVECFAVFYFPIQYIFEGVLSFRHTHRISNYFMMVCWVPCFFMNCIMLYWIFSSLIESLESGKRSSHSDLLVILRRLGKTMTFMAVILLVSQVFKILDISSNDPPASWHGQWILAEGMCDMLFLAVIGATMFIMAPFRNTKEYLYVANVSMNEMDADTIGSQAPAVWADEDGGGILDDEEQAEDEGFWTMTQEAKGKRSRGDDEAPKQGVAERDLLG
jgi:hypothetical protein